MRSISHPLVIHNPSVQLHRGGGGEDRGRGRGRDSGKRRRSGRDRDIGEGRRRGRERCRVGTKAECKGKRTEITETPSRVERCVGWWWG
jgi:hypothetical protein